jgi:hypothetical protein
LCFVAACFGAADAPGDAGAVACVEGMTAVCTCPDGRRGASACLVDGTMGECACADGPGGGDSAQGGDDGTTGTPTGGTSGGGTGGGGSGGRGGDGGSGGGEGGASGGGEGGSGGSGGADPPDAGADAGEPAPKDAGMDDDGKPEPGEAYAPCETADACHEKLECAAPPFATGGIGYCTVRCRENLGTATPCPKPPSGTVEVTCAALSGLCQLGSCEMADCPEGMVCKEQFVPSLPFGRTVYYCAYGD